MKQSVDQDVFTGSRGNEITDTGCIFHRVKDSRYEDGSLGQMILPERIFWVDKACVRSISAEVWDCEALVRIFRYHADLLHSHSLTNGGRCGMCLQVLTRDFMYSVLLLILEAASHPRRAPLWFLTDLGQIPHGAR